MILDIPLLFEKGDPADFDYVVTVSAPYEVQKQRVLARPNMTERKNLPPYSTNSCQMRKKPLALILLWIPLSPSKMRIAKSSKSSLN